MPEGIRAILDPALDVREQLQRLRERLLDLTNRNSLLNYRHTTRRSLRIVDELPDVIFEQLRDGQSLQLKPVPLPKEAELRRYWQERGQPVFDEEGRPLPLEEPAPEQWARQKGIRTDHDLPEPLPGTEPPKRHRDRQLQTLHYPQQLSDRLRRMRSDARSAIEERGVNMLFLALGFLQWKEAEQERGTHLAPLILLPVEIVEERATASRERRHALRLLPEELRTNLSLRMRLQRDFGLLLPAFEPGEDGEYPLPEEYFRQVEAAVLEQQPGWRVRRMATLGFFQFQKLMLFEDLDPEKWPGNALLNSALVRGMLGHGDLRAGGLPALQGEENDVELELMDLADSSQARAIKAALQGCNLVIQGPPGTGKSQTITNLVAAFLARGKRVLFLSEKMAALEVVHRRLQKMGLADFCLELHSHNTRRQSIIGEIAARLQLHRQAIGDASLQQQHEQLLQRLRETRQKLRDYTRLMLQQTSLQLPLHDVLQRAGALRLLLGEQQPGVDEMLRPLARDDVHALSWPQLQRQQQQLSALARTVQQLAARGFAPQTSAWRGISSAHVSELDHDALQQLTANALQRLQQLQQAHDTLAAAAGLALPQQLAAVTDQPRQVQVLQALWRLREPLRQAWQLVRQLRDTCDLPLPTGWDGLRMAARLLAHVMDLPRQDPALLDPVIADDRLDAVLADLRQRLQRLWQLRDSLQETFDLQQALRVEPQMLRDAAEVLRHAGWFAFLNADYRQARALWQRLVRMGRDNLPDNAARAERLLQLADHGEQFRQLQEDDNLRGWLGRLFAGVQTDVEQLQALRQWYRQGLERLQERADIMHGLLALPPERWRSLLLLAQQHGERLPALLRELPCDGSALLQVHATDWEDAWPQLCDACLVAPWDGWCRQQGVDGDVFPPALAEAAQGVHDAVAWFDEAWQALKERSGLDEDRWGAGAEGIAALTMAAVQERLQQMLQADAASFADWLLYDRQHRGVEGETARLLLLQMERGRLPVELLDRALGLVVFDAVARRLYREEPLLQAMDGLRLEQLRGEYAQLDAQMMQQRRAVLRNRLLTCSPPSGQRGPRKAQWTEMALLEHEAGKKRRHLPLRRVLQQAAEAVQTLLPCFMMSPLSMAQYLPAGQVTFDVLIMDEASQLKPEVCISALARCRQVVVVGDDRQMPPSTYFERMLGDDEQDEEERSVAEDAESILDLARPHCDQSMLRWHYRSRHESLIRFSNHKFYDGQLIVFPSPESTTERFGVRLLPVEDGIYARGRNVREAEAVVQTTLQRLQQGDGSIGIVAMNRQQQDLIEELLDQALMDDEPARLRVEMMEQNGEPLFVKNLENVQGDERDTIIISLTYGPAEPGGTVPQRFGPVNQAMGWRRLNVLFTRARERILLHASMRASDVVPDNEGRRVLHDYLLYAETGRLPMENLPSDARLPDRPQQPESPFEEAVLQALRADGWEAVPQVGVDGFFIDIGVRHPQQPGRWLLGVECDGASYHSGPYMRDRDRIRQRHLEHLGWRIHRIWSRDWFTAPERETQRLLDVLQAQLQQNA